MALAVLFRTNDKSQCGRHNDASNQEQVIQFSKQASAKSFQPSLFLMGMAFNPCTPLSLVIVAAATTANAWFGLLLGLAFGLGAVVLPTLIFAVGVAHFGNEVKKALSQWRQPLEKGSITMLFLMGTATALGWITP